MGACSAQEDELGALAALGWLPALAGTVEVLGLQVGADATGENHWPGHSGTTFALMIMTRELSICLASKSPWTRNSGSQSLNCG